MPALARLTLPVITALLLSGVPLTPLAAVPVEEVAGRITRADVIAGRVSSSQLHAYLRSSLGMSGATVPAEDEGGEVVVGSSGPLLGGDADPLLALDLDGDGGDELLFEQYSGSRSYVLAVDDDRLMWRYDLPKKVHLDGMFVGDVAPLSGEEVVFVAHKHVGEETEFLLAVFGSWGRIWTENLGKGWIEVTGLVEGGDEDPESEIALVSYESPVEVIVIDGWSGMVRARLSSSLTDTDLFTTPEVFVTDGSIPSAVDEAVFVTPLLGAGYHAERVRLSDGEVMVTDVVPNVDTPYFAQGADHSGDGRRDAFVFDFDSYGVFDAATLRVLWTNASEDAWSTWVNRYPAGDADGEAGDEVCFRTSTWDNIEDGIDKVTGGARCDRGRTGVALWQVERSAQAQEQPEGSEDYRYPSVGVWLGSDLSGDALPDPMIDAGVIHCYESGDWFGCEVIDREHVAASGRDASVLWTDPPIDGDDTVYVRPMAEDVDGVAGDDLFARPDSGSPDVGRPRFSILNGLDFTRSWTATVGSGGLDGYVGDAIGADLDGDGTNEIVVSAVTWEFVSGDPDCWDYCEYEEYLYAAAFSADGEPLWQLEL